MKDNRRRRQQSGSGLPFVLIVLAILMAGVFWVVHLRRQAEADGRAFAREVIQKCAFEHDPRFLPSVVDAKRRLTVPRAKDDEFVATLKQLGAPDPNYTMTGDLQFDNYIGAPRGTFKAILTFPDRHGTIFISIERPSGFWLVEDYGIYWERPAE